ncbi:MAG: hypothetical protein MR362_00840 [Hallerella sp.]|uniref:Lipoprotein n=1 Tax=Hallerella porci TaxID=1945871 RepID=A0ABX5LNG5_9BACT|nr:MULTISPECIES: hypothetical protein [Hallerella]MCI5599831.1 hypothetical protein [Hallerella sp.]PWL03497.1 hypothetical protein B0H50_10539 [Hallerella porci]
MNFKKVMTAFGLVASFGLAACSSDSSSGADPEDLSSSSSAPIVLPETNGDSLVKFTSMNASPSGATSIIFTGSVSTNLDADTSAVIDSINFKLGNETGGQITSSFTFTQLTAPTANLNLIKLSPALDLTSFKDCGNLSAYLIVYGHSLTQSFVAIDTIPFAKGCVVEESSSSVAVEDPVLTAWEVELSTSATKSNAVDLDSKTVYFKQQISAETAPLLDLYLARENKAPVLYTNGNLTEFAVANASTIVPETKSASDYLSYPKPAHVSDFAFKDTPTNSVTDFETTAFIVKTPSYDETTGKGFYVILPHEAEEAGSSVSMTLTILGVW